MDFWTYNFLIKIAIVSLILFYWKKNEKNNNHYFDVRSLVLNGEIWKKILNIINNPANFIIFIVTLIAISSSILCLRIVLIILLACFLLKYNVCYYKKKSFISYYKSTDVKFYPSLKNITWNLWLQLYFTAHNIFYAACFISSNKIRPEIDILLIICNILITMLLGFPFICLLISFDITEAVASVFKRKYKINYIKFAILEELNNLILTKFPYHKDFSTAPTRKIHFKNGKTFNPKGVLVNPKDTTRLGSYFVKQKYHLYIHNDVIGGETLGISATSHPKPWMRTIPMYSKPQSGKSFMVINQQYDTKLINEDISFVKQIAYNTGTQNNEVREFLLNNAAQARFFEEMETHKLKFDHTVEKEFGRYYKIASENKTLDPEIRKVAEMVENKYHNLTKKDLIDLMETHNFLTEQYDKMLGAPFDYNDFMQLKKNTYSSKNFEDFFKIINNALQEILNN